jgi:hypothetical protein
MPYQLQRDTTPAGVSIVRLDSSGRILAVDATEMMKEISPGGQHHGLPMLVISNDGVEVTAEARRIFTQRVGDEAGPPTAIVSTSMVMRVTINFISRVNGNTNMRLFSTEPDAVQWLDAMCAPQEPKR